MTPPASSTAVLVLAHARAPYLHRCLGTLLAHRPARPGPADDESGGGHPFPVFVCQDGAAAATRLVATRAARRFPAVSHLQYPHARRPGGGTRPDAAPPYAYISAHYWTALSWLFDTLGFAAVIVLEGDLEIAPDFFTYFQAFGPRLRAGPPSRASGREVADQLGRHSWQSGALVALDAQVGRGIDAKVDLGLSLHPGGILTAGAAPNHRPECPGVGTTRRGVVARVGSRSRGLGAQTILASALVPSASSRYRW